MTERERLIDFLNSIRDYERESHNSIGFDERESGEFVDQYLSTHPVKELATDDSEWFRKSIAEEMTRKELEDRLVEQNEIINQLRNNVNSLLEADEPKQVTDELQQLMNEWFIWATKTFPSATSLSHARHLQKEAAELCEVLIETPNESPLNQSLRHEFADCFILILNTASRCGFTIRELMNCGIEKMEINKKRKWGKPDKDGVVEHLRSQLSEHPVEVEKSCGNCDYFYESPRCIHCIDCDNDYSNWQPANRKE